MIDESHNCTFQLLEIDVGRIDVLDEDKTEAREYIAGYGAVLLVLNKFHILYILMGAAN